MQLEQKACAHCNQEIVRPARLGNKQWAKRRFCSRSCVDASRVRTKPWKDIACRAPRFEKARQIFRRGLRDGVIVRPTVCEECGAEPLPLKDGRSSIQGHHHDYTKPLEVRWLCIPCHRSVTPVVREFTGPRKLTAEQVRTIRAEYQPHVVTYAMLSKRFGVTMKVLQGIIAKRTWKNV